jgi:ribosomal protein S4E
MQKSKVKVKNKQLEKVIPQYNKIKNGAHCTVIAGTHAGKSGMVRDINTSKTGHVTITVIQANGVRFKTLAKNVKVITKF